MGDPAGVHLLDDGADPGVRCRPVAQADFQPDIHLHDVADDIGEDVSRTAATALHILDHAAGLHLDPALKQGFQQGAAIREMPVEAPLGHAQ